MSEGEFLKKKDLNGFRLLPNLNKVGRSKRWKNAHYQFPWKQRTGTKNHPGQTLPATIQKLRHIMMENRKPEQRGLLGEFFTEKESASLF